MKQLFDYPSIEANKQGKKSEAQVKLIKEATGPGIWLGGGIILFVIGGCFYAFLFAIEAGGAGGIFGGILGVAGTAALIRGLVIWRLNRRLLSEPVQSAEGWVTYKTQESEIAKFIDIDRFIAETDHGKQLYPAGLAGVVPQLPPGRYRFYYLNAQNWLLSAEPLSSEEEMRQALNTILARALNYNLEHLEQCRKEAREGKLSIVEGKPKIEPTARLSNQVLLGPSQAETVTPIFYCTLGEVQFLLPRRGSYAMLTDLPYRAYYRASESQTLFGNLLNLMKDKTIEAIELA